MKKHQPRPTAIAIVLKHFVGAGGVAQWWTAHLACVGPWIPFLSLQNGDNHDNKF
jgi:hypothetical protein